MSPTSTRTRGSSSGRPASAATDSRFHCTTAPDSSLTATAAVGPTTSSAARNVNPKPNPPTSTEGLLETSRAQPMRASASSLPWRRLFISTRPSICTRNSSPRCRSVHPPSVASVFQGFIALSPATAAAATQRA